MTDGAKQPSDKVRVGNVQLAEWSQEIEKDGRKFTAKNYTITRSFQDKDGEWQNTNSYGENDLWKIKIGIDYMLKKKAVSEKTN